MLHSSEHAFLWQCERKEIQFSCILIWELGILAQFLHNCCAADTLTPIIFRGQAACIFSLVVV